MEKFEEGPLSRMNKSQIEAPEGQFGDTDNLDKKDMPINI